MKLSSNRSIVNCGLTSAHDTCTLSLSSSTEEIKRYFKAILELSKLNVPYPVNLDSCWMLAYSRKDNATKELTKNFIQDVDYQVLRQKSGKPKRRQTNNRIPPLRLLLRILHCPQSSPRI